MRVDRNRLQTVSYNKNKKEKKKKKKQIIIQHSLTYLRAHWNLMTRPIVVPFGNLLLLFCSIKRNSSRSIGQIRFTKESEKRKREKQNKASKNVLK